jgi:hypothetical protein
MGRRPRRSSCADRDAPGSWSGKQPHTSQDAAIAEIDVSENGCVGAHDARHFYLPCAAPRSSRDKPQDGKNRLQSTAHSPGRGSNPRLDPVGQTTAARLVRRFSGEKGSRSLHKMNAATRSIKCSGVQCSEFRLAVLAGRRPASQSPLARARPLDPTPSETDPGRLANSSFPEL